jgi:hypothetical protein
LPFSPLCIEFIFIQFQIHAHKTNYQDWLSPHKNISGPPTFANFEQKILGIPIRRSCTKVKAQTKTGYELFWLRSLGQNRLFITSSRQIFRLDTHPLILGGGDLGYRLPLCAILGEIPIAETLKNCVARSFPSGHNPACFWLLAPAARLLDHKHRPSVNCLVDQKL